MDDVLGGNAVKELKHIISGIEKLESDRSDLADDIRDKYAKAKGDGFDTKIIRQVIKRRKLDREQREYQDQMVETYEAALTEEDIEEMME